MLIAQIILLIFQSLNVIALIILGIQMATSDARYRKRQEEYKRRYLEIQDKYSTSTLNDKDDNKRTEYYRIWERTHREQRNEYHRNLYRLKRDQIKMEVL